MNKLIDWVLKELIPPFFLKLLGVGSYRISFEGNFLSWSEAKRNSSGYDKDLILERVKESLLKVKRGEAAYERDSVVFGQIQYSWPLLSGLLWIAVQSANRLNIIDFGGSLGSSYFQNKKILSTLDKIRWNVVEQKSFVKSGQEYFQNEELLFYDSIDACLVENKPDVILLSSVLPYLEKPHDLLNEIAVRQLPFVIIDRTPIIEGAVDRLTVQKVPSSIYKASYPAWFFSRNILLSHFSESYELVEEFDALSGEIFLGDTMAIDKGFIFKLKSI